MVLKEREKEPRGREEKGERKWVKKKRKRRKS